MTDNSSRKLQFQSQISALKRALSAKEREIQELRDANVVLDERSKVAQHQADSVDQILAGKVAGLLSSKYWTTDLDAEVPQLSAGIVNASRVADLAELSLKQQESQLADLDVGLNLGTGASLNSPPLGELRDLQSPQGPALPDWLGTLEGAPWTARGDAGRSRAGFVPPIDSAIDLNIPQEIETEMRAEEKSAKNRLEQGRQDLEKGLELRKDKIALQEEVDDLRMERDGLLGEVNKAAVREAELSAQEAVHAEEVSTLRQEQAALSVKLAETTGRMEAAEMEAERLRAISGRAGGDGESKEAVAGPETTRLWRERLRKRERHLSQAHQQLNEMAARLSATAVQGEGEGTTGPAGVAVEASKAGTEPLRCIQALSIQLQITEQEAAELRQTLDETEAQQRLLEAEVNEVHRLSEAKARQLEADSMEQRRVAQSAARRQEDALHHAREEGKLQAERADRAEAELVQLRHRIDANHQQLKAQLKELRDQGSMDLQEAHEKLVALNRQKQHAEVTQHAASAESHRMQLRMAEAERAEQKAHEFATELQEELGRTKGDLQGSQAAHEHSKNMVKTLQEQVKGLEKTVGVLEEKNRASRQASTHAKLKEQEAAQEVARLNVRRQTLESQVAKADADTRHARQEIQSLLHVKDLEQQARDKAALAQDQVQEMQVALGVEREARANVEAQLKKAMEELAWNKDTTMQAVQGAANQQKVQVQLGQLQGENRELQHQYQEAMKAMESATRRAEKAEGDLAEMRGREEALQERLNVLEKHLEPPQPHFASPQRTLKGSNWALRSSVDLDADSLRSQLRGMEAEVEHWKTALQEEREHSRRILQSVQDVKGGAQPTSPTEVQAVRDEARREVTVESASHALVEKAEELAEAERISKMRHALPLPLPTRCSPQ
ncbi:hypothetical protein CYMTET_17221 [Cymbomonas tetramitiformis]|uniref:Uncharacterized protein n=1 Tax=Cymbomonas tetramitiformis TaxID=36881 RepID=A0AAE0L7H2_9CHLO|nr:hypothetical protein CYMTET_17221 [Cymbomonas tetramitiformis]